MTFPWVSEFRHSTCNILRMWWKVGKRVYKVGSSFCQHYYLWNLISWSYLFILYLILIILLNIFKILQISILTHQFPTNILNKLTIDFKWNNFALHVCIDKGFNYCLKSHAAWGLIGVCSKINACRGAGACDRHLSHLHRDRPLYPASVLLSISGSKIKLYYIV